MAAPTRLPLAMTAETARFLRSPSQVLRSVLGWRQRQRSRMNLSRLDAHLLRDIGLSEQDATTEIRKPFWRD